MNPKLPVIVIKFLISILIATILVTNPTKVFAKFDFVKNTQPIFPPSQNSWDRNHVVNSFIDNNLNTYDMWYAGEGGAGWHIGFAQQNKSTNVWTRNDSIIFQSQPGLPQTEASDPFLIKNADGSYKMWYDAYYSGNFIIEYATSPNGQTWTKYATTGLGGTSGKWDAGGTARGKSVIFDGTTYHIWYAATDGGGSWSIGYATWDGNPDHPWEKQHGGEPVITKDTNEELVNNSYPDVFFAYGKYHMFYGTGSGDMPTKILYANSDNGIIWDKPEDMNPVITYNAYPWEDHNIASPYVLIDGNKLKMWYSSSGTYLDNPNDVRWQIAYAEAPLSDLPGAPQQPPTTKVVIIPGLGGTWNTEALMNCTLDPIGEWGLTNFVGATDPYQPLADEFTSKQRIPHIFLYDWRQKIDLTAPKLAEFINPKIDTAAGERIDLVGHSLGGLVARSYFQLYGSDNRIEHLLTVGTPHGGTALAYPAWSGGDVWWNNMAQRIALTSIIKFCSALKMKSDREIIQTMVPSIGQILPRDTFLVNKADGSPKNTTHAVNTFPLASLTSPLFGTTISTIYGTGIETLNTITVKDPSAHDTKIGNWLDGKPVKTTTTTIDGDGTVLAKDGQINGAGIENIPVHTDHFGLVSSLVGKNALFSALGLPISTALSTVYQAPASALVLISWPGGFNMINPDGDTIPDRNGFIGYLNPKKGSYHVLFKSHPSTRRFVIAQFLPNGKTLWKEYSENDVANAKGIISFDPDNPVEDALQ